MNTENRIVITGAIFIFAVVLALSAAAVWQSAAHANPIDDLVPVSYINVSVTKITTDSDYVTTNFSITWSDAEECTTDYNAYLVIAPGYRSYPDDYVPAEQIHLGSAASDGVEIAKELSDLQGFITGFRVSLYCGTVDSGRGLSGVYMGRDYTSAGPRPGNYSTEPALSALSTSSGTLTQVPVDVSRASFNIEDIPDADNRITITATAKTGHYVKFYEGTEDPAQVLTLSVYSPSPSGKIGDNCGFSISDPIGKLKELTDAAPDTPGFQVNLYDGENYVMLRVFATGQCTAGEGYFFSATRPEGGEYSLIRPNRPAFGGVHIRPSYLGSRNSWVYPGLTQSASTHKIRDRDGMDNAVFGYQWLADDTEIEGATSSTYTVTETDLGKTLKIRVSFTDDRDHEETRTSHSTPVVKLRNQYPKGKPIIHGTREVGQTLRADVSGITDGNGLTNATFTYSWENSYLRSNLRSNSSELTLWPEDEGRNIRLRLSFTDDAGHEAVMSSDYITGVAARLGSGAPTVVGTARVGETLTVDTSSITDSHGMDNATFSYQWLSSSYQWRSNNYTEIEGATGPSYILRAADAGKAIRVSVSFTDDAGNDETLFSAATAAVRQNVPPTGVPTITGNAEVGETLTADTSGIVDSDGLDNVSFSYQWIRSDGRTATDYPGAPFTSVPSGGNNPDLDIDGATSATYTVTAADADKTIKLRVDFTDDKGSVETLTSSATVVVPVEAALTFSLDGTTVSCDSYNVHIVNLPKEECDDPSSIDQGASGEIEVEIEIARSVSSQLYKFRFHIYQVEDSIGNHKSHEANDLCLGPGLADSVSMEVTPDDVSGNFTYTDEGTIFNLCPAGTYQLYVPWYRYNYEDQEYEYAGTFRRYFFINGDDEDATLITPLYPDTPFAHGEVEIRGHKQSEVLNRTLTTFSLSIDGLVPDSDAETTDYVVRVRIIGDGGPVINGAPVEEVAWCHVGNVGYSHLIKTVPEDGRWAMEAHVLGSCIEGQWPDTLQAELFDGSDLTDYSEPIVIDGSYVYSHTGELQYPEYGTHEFIAGKDIALGSLSNSAATGAPTISGTAEVGETLTADTSGIADENGLDNATFTYQWLSSRDMEISGATGSTYTLVSTDLGKIIKVKVTFTDDEGNQESLTSAATAVVAATVPGVARSVAAERGGTGRIDVSWEVPASNGGSAITSYTVQWKEATGNWDTDADVSEATTTATSYTISRLSLGTEYAVRVIATNSVGDGPASTDVKETADAQTSQQQSDTENTPATGAPTISETPEVGRTLSAETSGISDSDGLANVAFTYQWISSEGTTDTDVSGATGSTYTLVSNDEDKTIKVRVSFTDDAGNDETLTSAATAAVEAALTAELQGVPNSHNGSGTFTFRILFSEPVTVGFAALKEHSFQVSNATIKRAQRVNGRNDLRKFTIQPSSDTAVVMVLPVIGDCTAEGAICTTGGKRLSTRLEINVPGPAPANSAAAGAPTISGTAQVGETLTASTSDISDADGLDNASFNYQWFADDTERSGATDITYTLTDSDEGKAIKVGVSFTDDRGNDETLTSEATASVVPRPNSPATGAPTISGTAQVGETLTAGTSDISDNDGTDNATFNHQWLADDVAISEATGSSYTLSDAEEGKAVRVQVSFTDDRGNEETLTSIATDAVSPAGQQESEPTTEPTDRPHGLRSSAEGRTVTLTWNAPDDDAGVTMYRILRHRPEEGEPEPLVYVEYTHSRDTSYADTGVEPGTLYVYSVQAADVFGFVGEASNPASVRVPKINSPATGAPTVSGTAQVGETLTAEVRGITDEDGLDNASYSYQWLRVDDSVETGIQDATSETYTLVDADQGKTVKVQVSFTDDQGNDETLTSEATPAVAGAAPQNSPATGVPTITGTTQVGETLTADVTGIADQDGRDNAAFSYQWLRMDDSVETDIQDATASTYTLVDADEGKTIKVRVSFTDDQGNDETLTSEATPAVTGAPPQNNTATGAPTIAGTVKVGQVLTADATGIDDQDGTDNAQFTYQWLADDTAITGATDATYLLTASEKQKVITVTVSFNDDEGNEEALTSAATVAVTTNPLTASVENEPNAHDGQNDFTFELRFSEQFGLSYQTLTNHAFTVVGGSIQQAKRLDRDGKTPNVRWAITVRPDGNGDVTITLPETTDCDSEGAICTSDRRMLSNSLEFTVAGPGQ